jgi:hypothetical protein
LVLAADGTLGPSAPPVPSPSLDPKVAVLVVVVARTATAPRWRTLAPVGAHSPVCSCSCHRSISCTSRRRYNSQRPSSHFRRHVCGHTVNLAQYTPGCSSACACSVWVLACSRPSSWPVQARTGFWHLGDQKSPKGQKGDALFSGLHKWGMKRGYWSKMLRCVKLPLGVPRDHAGRGGTNIGLAGPDWSTIGSGPNPNTAPQRRTIARAETRAASLRLVGLGLAWAAAAPSHLLPP